MIGTGQSGAVAFHPEGLLDCHRTWKEVALADNGVIQKFGVVGFAVAFSRH
jgi:hypothetical protein